MAQFGLLLTAKKAAAHAVAQLRRRQLVHTLAEGQATRAATKFVHCEHQRAPQDRQASEPAALALRPAV